VCDGESSVSQFVREAGGAPADCEGLCPQTIFARINARAVDIFKIDIEGAETLLFSSRTQEWLPRCELVFVDVHSPDAIAAVRSAARISGFQCEAYREMLVLRRRPQAVTDRWPQSIP